MCKYKGNKVQLPLFEEPFCLIMKFLIILDYSLFEPSQKPVFHYGLFQVYLGDALSILT